MIQQFHVKSMFNRQRQRHELWIKKYPNRPDATVGPALTVWTYPGDWARPVEAIDHADEGAVLVIDVRGEGPAVWGEEASKSCITRGLAGVVINGALRDSREIGELDFPAFSAPFTPESPFESSSASLPTFSWSEEMPADSRAPFTSVSAFAASTRFFLASIPAAFAVASWALAGSSLSSAR